MGAWKKDRKGAYQHSEQNRIKPAEVKAKKLSKRKAMKVEMAKRRKKARG